MKAERRHDLKTNALARGIEEMPDHWRDYGSKVLLLVLVAAIVFLLVRYWNDKKARDVEQLVTARQTVQSQLQLLDRLPFQYSASPSNLLADERQEISRKADESINTLLTSSKLTADKANAYLARGDLNWKLANLPELPGADTQPTLKIQNREGLLDQARVAYETALQPQYSPSVGNAFYAHLGLAAIAENQHDWTKAKAQYQAVVDAANMPASFKDYAKDQLVQLPQYELPAVIVPAPPAAPATAPTTDQATTTQAASQPTTDATTQPAVTPPSTTQAVIPSSAPAATAPVPAATAPTTTTSPATKP